MALTNTFNTTDQYIQSPTNPYASIKNPNYIAPASVANSPMVADNLIQKTEPVKVSSGMTDTNTNLYKSILAGTTSLINNFNTYLGEQKTKEADITNANTEPEWLKKYLEAPAPTNPMETYNTMYGTSDIDVKQQAVNESNLAVKNAQYELNSINAELQGLTDQAKVEELRMKQEGLTQAGATARNITRERNLAIQALPLQAKGLLAQAKIASAQGDQQLAQNALEQAQSKFETLYKVQVDYEKQLYDYYQKQRDAVLQYASDDQKAKLEAQKIQDQNKFEMKKIEFQNQLDINKAKIENQLNPPKNTLNPETPITSFTDTQINKGAATASMPLDDFKKLDADTQNFFINNSSEITSKKKLIDDAFANKEDPSKLEEEISSSNLPNAVKDMLVKYLKEVFKNVENKTSWWQSFWSRGKVNK